MTSLYLLLWIAGGVLLQTAIYLCIGFWQHWQAYQALRQVAEKFEISVNTSAAAEVSHPGTAWAGYRSFSVERKVVEDATKQVCSFYLVPDDGKPLDSFLPGQFLTFQLDTPANAGGRQAVVRCYSLSDAPHPKRYRISVKRAPAPAGSSFCAGVSSNYLVLDREAVIPNGRRPVFRSEDFPQSVFLRRFQPICELLADFQPNLR